VTTPLLLLGVALAGPRLIAPGAVDAAGVDRLLRGRRLALLVGPSGFEDPRLAQLRYTGDDAGALAEVLGDPERGGFDAVWTLTGPEATGVDAVRRAMSELDDAARSPDDTVFVYFSTHGSLARDAQGRLAQYLVLQDTRLEDLPGTGLAHDEVLSWLAGLPSRRKVLLLATCHSGQGKSGLPSLLAAQLASTKSAPAPPPLRDVSEAVVIIGVCAWDETARESEALGHDIYTWHFLEGLERADLDGDGAVTVTEAHHWAREGTYAYTDGAQRPYALAEILGGDPVVLTGRPGAARAATLGSYQPSLDGYRVRVDGELKGELPGLVILEEGSHRLELVDPARDRVVAPRRLRRAGGGRVDASSLLRQDLLRFGVGGGWQSLSAPGAGGPAIAAELHLPRWPGWGWEIISHGSAVARWPHPTLTGGLNLERPLTPGAVQLRAGAGAQALLLGAPGDPALLAPSLVPELVLSAVALPRGRGFLRATLAGGYLWYTDQGSWHHGYSVRAGLVVGGGGDLPRGR